jgi:hypothetical protein
MKTHLPQTTFTDHYSKIVKSCYLWLRLDLENVKLLDFIEIKELTVIPSLSTCGPLEYKFDFKDILVQE